MTRPTPVAIRDLPLLFDNMADVLVNSLGYDSVKATVLDSSLEWLATKRLSLSNAAYLDQLEKNALYFRETAAACDLATAIYFHEADPILPQEQIQAYVYNQRAVSQQTTRDHLAYLRNGCAGCGSHQRHSLYAELRRLRSAGPQARYLEELEFEAVAQRAFMTTSEQFLAAFLQNYQFAGALRAADFGTIINVVNNRSAVWGSMWAGLMKLNVKMERNQQGEINFIPVPPPTRRPTWREVWGEQYDALVRSLKAAT